MKKILLVLLIAAAFGGGIVAYLRHTRKSETPSVLNPALAANYNKIGALLKPNAEPSDQAVRSLKELTQRDAKNALGHYLLAAAYAKKSQWTDTLGELKAGNDADYCVAYQEEDALFGKLPNYAALRDLTRNCAAAAPTLSGNRGEPLLLAARGMGTRIARMEPQMLISLLVGVAMRSITDRGLVSLYSNAGRTKDAEAAQARLNAERAWTKSPQFRTESGLDQAEAEQDALLAKYHVTGREVLAASNGIKMPADKRKRIVAFNKTTLERERTRTEKLLQSLPE